MIKFRNEKPTRRLQGAQKTLQGDYVLCQCEHKKAAQLGLDHRLVPVERPVPEIFRHPKDLKSRIRVGR